MWIEHGTLTTVPSHIECPAFDPRCTHSTDGFETRVFWWELVELGRKLLLVGYLALVSPGSILQLFIALVAALALGRAHAR